MVRPFPSFSFTYCIQESQVYVDHLRQRWDRAVCYHVRAKIHHRTLVRMGASLVDIEVAFQLATLNKDLEQISCIHLRYMKDEVTAISRAVQHSRGDDVTTDTLIKGLELVSSALEDTVPERRH
ncbi:hypothetical protein LIER_17324 [Lithospermum erythrorhizon]|uniref:Uncharacterized protein n=1 Tax=Lithospermum erythrorhizon TaxID=34254 RepID=A0AAV3QCF3_LITER